MAMNAGMMKEALDRKMVPALDMPVVSEPTGDREAGDLQAAIDILEGVESDDPEANAKLAAIINDLKTLMSGEPKAPEDNKISEQVPQEPV